MNTQPYVLLKIICLLCRRYSVLPENHPNYHANYENRTYIRCLRTIIHNFNIKNNIKLILSMNYNLRYHPVFQKVVEKIEKNRYPYFLLCENYTSQVGYNLEHFRWLEKNPRGYEEKSFRSSIHGPRIRMFVVYF
jgi:hypothetical protein